MNDRTLAEHLAPASPAAADAAALMSQIHAGVIVVQDSLIAYANPAYGAMVGWPLAELIGRHHHMTCAPESRAAADAVVKRRLEGRPGRPGTMRALRRDGSEFDV
ncbi:MAG: PAS domain S-box protein, partial [Burkholderiales bacterium]|nr:PAS domain S-box protein [Burkholderiales bacterium]